jgi:colanic acid biosynthesis glycosyl transferase WcaI
MRRDDLSPDSDRIRPETRAANIAYLSVHYWPETIGSAPYSTDVAEHLASLGHKVTVVACRPHYPSETPFADWNSGARDREEHAGVSIFRVSAVGRGSGSIIDRVRLNAAFLLGIIKVIGSGELSNCDVVVAYVPTCLSLVGAALLRWHGRVKTTAVVHDIESGLAGALAIARSSALVSLLRWIEGVCINRADEVIVLSDGMAQELRQLGCRRPMTVLPIWTTIPPQSPVSTTEHPIVMYSGNFGRKQNLDQLFPLIARLDKFSPNVRVELRGDGSERERIVNSIQEMGVKNVSFSPLVPVDKLFESLQQAHVHLVPQALNVSNYASPSKLFTIMSAGRPFVCIAEKNTALDRIASESGGGICVPPGDDDLLYATLMGLLRDRARLHEMGAKGRRYVALNMDRSRVLELYASVILSTRRANG